METRKNDTKKLFLSKGTCSQTFGHLLNREFGNCNFMEERALDPLAGGILRRGHQCGMLWGASLAVGAEAARRHSDSGRAVAAAITATRSLVTAFENTAHCIDCRDVTRSNWMRLSGILKYFFTGKLFTCLRLSEKWTSGAIEAAKTGLSQVVVALPANPKSCASEVARKMGASEAEIIRVAGFAGGLGLSGLGCGALGAAIWLNTLAFCRNHPDKEPFSNEYAHRTLAAFCQATDSNFLCQRITGERFQTITDHTRFLEDGGCANLLNVLAAFPEGD